MKKNTAESHSSSRKALREAGYKATPDRFAVLDILARSRTPLSIKRIMALAKGMDQVTVYRTLKTLKDADLVRQVDLEHGHAHFELTDPKDHHHLICTNCGKIEDFGGCDMEPLVKKALRGSKQFGAVTRHSLEFFGLCKACSKKR